MRTAGIQMLLARGNSARPVFQRLMVSTTAQEPTHISLLPAVNDTVLFNGHLVEGQAPSEAAGAGTSGKPRDAMVLGPDNVGQPVGLRKANAGDSASRPTTSGQKRTQPEANGPQAHPMPMRGDPHASDDEAHADEDQRTFAERVKALDVATEVGRPSVQQELNPPLKGAVKNPLPPPLKQRPATSGPVKADSLLVLLTQALRSNDRALLERCLNVSDHRMINNTVRARTLDFMLV